MEKDMADDIMEEEFEDTAEDIVADKINREAERVAEEGTGRLWPRNRQEAEKSG